MMQRTRNLRHAPWLALIAVMFLVQPAPAVAQDADVRTLAQRIDRLQRDLRTLERDYYRGQRTGAQRLSGDRSSGAGGHLANAEIRMSNLEDNMRKLNGQLEEVRHQMSSMLKRLDGLVKDVDFRLTEIEHKLAARSAGGSAAPGAGGAPPAAASGNAAEQSNDKTQAPAAAAAAKSVLPEGSPMDRYNYAYALLTKMQLAEAEAAFQEFLAQHGDDKLAGNAMFWLGQTYFTQERYSDAARTFLTGIQRYPDSNKAPDTMLKLGISLGKMGQLEEACATFREMQSQFPNLRDRLRRLLLDEVKTTGCR